MNAYPCVRDTLVNVVLQLILRCLHLLTMLALQKNIIFAYGPESWVSVILEPTRKKLKHYSRVRPEAFRLIQLVTYFYHKTVNM